MLKKKNFTAPGEKNFLSPKLVSNVSNELRIYIRGSFFRILVTGPPTAGKSPPPGAPVFTMPGGGCAVWDLTASADRNPFEIMKDFFNKHCKKWAFQKEQGTQTGYLHWQCRFSLNGKHTENAVKALLFGEDIEAFHVSRTSKNATKGPAFYVIKEYTRVEGPWTDQDPAPIPLTKTSRKLDELGLLPWQNSLMLETMDYNDRRIHCVVDKDGNNGKGALCKWAYVKGLAQLIPPFNNYGDLIQFAFSRPRASLYLIDMPRAMPKKNLFEMYQGIETLKDGYMFDKRYKGQFELIDEPNIVVFTNTPPKKRYLTRDRWRVWTVENEELVVYTYPVYAAGGQLHVGEDTASDQE